MNVSPPGDPPEHVEGMASLIGRELAFAETEAGRRALSRAAAKAVAAENLTGEVLAGRYRLLREVGRGGMGAVYLAEHTLIGKTVAVKVLSYEHSQRPQDIERFLLEARAASKIRHEHIVDITDFGYTDDGLAFLVMEYLEGEDLAGTCKREGRLPWGRVLAIAEQICAGLSAAHRGGIVHRDMKLENCFRIKRGDNEDFIKVLDFGIATILDDGQPSAASAASAERTGTTDTADTTKTSSLVGTPEYIAPELVRGQKGDARADIYAVGVAMYKLLTGEVPLRGESYMATLTKHLLEQPLPPRRRVPSVEIPESVDKIVMRALEKDPEKRYQSVEEMSAALALLRSEAELAKPRSRGLWIALPIIAVVAVVAVILAALVLSGGDEAAETSSQELTAGVSTTRADAELSPSPSPNPSPAGTSTSTSSSSSSSSSSSTADAGAESDTGQPTSGDSEVAREPEAKPAASPRLSEKLSTRELNRGLNGVQALIKRCSAKYAIPGMEVKVRLRIVGATGQVSSAEPQGSHEGTSLGVCIVRAVRKASFSKKKADTVVTRTFKM